MIDHERALIGTLCLRPDFFKLSEELSPDLFSDDRLKQIFLFLSEHYEKNESKEISIVEVTERFKGEILPSFITGFFDGLPRLSPESFLRIVKNIQKQQIAARLASKLKWELDHGLKTGQAFNFDSLRPDLAELDRLEKPLANPADFLVAGRDIRKLELQVEWVWKLIPERAITVLHSPGGLGKTWLALQLSKAVSEGIPFLGLPTKRRPVTYVDFENPLPVLKERVCRLEIQDVNFWTLAAETPPPKLDSRDYTLYKKLQPGLLIFDSFRSAFDGDENASGDVAPIMGRLKEIRELGFDILVIHHTPKANERLYKGSGAISDLADHVLAFHRVRRGSLEEIDDAGDLDPNAPLSLSTAKTRFEPGRLFLSFNPTGVGFSLAADPQLEALEAIADYIAGEGRGKNQGEIIAWAKDNLGGGRRESLVGILKRGEREGRWRSRKDKMRRIYEPAF